jgi:hypothetical protein
MTKDINIAKVLKILKRAFGAKTFKEVDYWNDEFAIGLQKSNKLIYISTAAAAQDEDYYFYECELLVDDPDKVYISNGCDEGNTKDLLKTISDFFEIPPICGKN